MTQDWQNPVSGYLYWCLDERGVDGERWMWVWVCPRREMKRGWRAVLWVMSEQEGLFSVTYNNQNLYNESDGASKMNGVPSWTYAGASSPRADVVSFDSLSDPRLRIALRRASARAAALDIVVDDEHDNLVVVEDGRKRTWNARRVATVIAGLGKKCVTRAFQCVPVSNATGYLLLLTWSLLLLTVTHSISAVGNTIYI